MPCLTLPCHFRCFCRLCAAGSCPQRIAARAWTVSRWGSDICGCHAVIIVGFSYHYLLGERGQARPQTRFLLSLKSTAIWMHFSPPSPRLDAPGLCQQAQRPGYPRHVHTSGGTYVRTREPPSSQPHHLRPSTSTASFTNPRSKLPLQPADYPSIRSPPHAPPLPPGLHMLLSKP